MFGRGTARAKATAHRDFTIAKIDNRLYGAFLEHLGRAIYTGIYEPDHPSADANGMRGNVIELVKALDIQDIPVIRYPGGNFVSTYNWEDGIGPVSERPTRLDLAWHTSESNEVGIHEFAEWCDSVGTEMMLAFNLGSCGLDAARNLVEYVNHPGGSYWSDLRKKNGRAEPWNVKLWALGNEMDGPWQIGRKTAEQYGQLANETAKAVRAFDSTLEMVVYGSSASDMPTYPDWEATVLDQSYENVDYISLHMYFRNDEKNSADYLALSEKLDRYIGTIAATIDYIKAKKRSKKNVYISFDEWNVWYHSNHKDKPILSGDKGWPLAPPLLEDIYNFEDALMVGCALNTFIRRSDVVKIAAIAQLVNVIAPIMTEKGGKAWKQTTYYPFYYASRYGRGTALKLTVDGPGYDCAHGDNVPYLDISAVRNEEAGTVTVFAVNRHKSETLELDLSLQGFGTPVVIEHKVMTHPSLEAHNSADKPNEVVPRDGSGVKIDGGKLIMGLPPHSYQMLRLKA